MRTLEEYKELISNQIDEVTILDLLGLTTQEIVEAFSDKIEDNLPAIINYLEVD